MHVNSFGLYARTRFMCDRDRAIYRRGKKPNPTKKIDEEEENEEQKI